MTVQLLALMFAVSVCPWGLSLLFRGRIEAVGMAVLIAGIIFGPQFYSFSLGIGMSIDRLLLMLGCGLCGLRILQGEAKLPRPRKVDLLLAGFCIWIFVSTLGASVPAGAEPARSRWMTFILMPVVLYFLARCSVIRSSDCKHLVTALIGLGVYLGLTGMCEVSGLHAVVFPRYIVDPNNWEFLGRARGPILNPTGNGTVLTAAFAAALARVVHSKQLEQVGYLAAAGIIGVGIVATLTRSVWLGGFLVVATYGWIYFRRFLPAVGLLGAAAVIGLSAMASQIDIMNIKRDKHLSAADAKKSVELRPVLAMVAWEMFKDRPLRGHGYGGYFESSPTYLAKRTQEASFEMVRPYMQHNVILSLLVDSGLIAVGLFLSWTLLTCLTAYRLARLRSATDDQRIIGLVVLGTMVPYYMNGMFHDVSVIPMLNAVLFFLSGLCTTVAAEKLPSVTPVLAVDPNAEPRTSPQLAAPL
ncbi:MAG: O-antigen ligase family protein [Aureliella sp.]